MTVHHEDPWLAIHVGDCRDVLIDLNPAYADQQLARAARGWDARAPIRDDEPTEAPPDSWLAALEATA